MSPSSSVQRVPVVRVANRRRRHLGGQVLEQLESVEAELPGLLEEVTGWSSLDIDYHPPRVQRLYRRWRDLRLNLHRIWPCDAEVALFHPHPWPSAMKVVDGTYRMSVGFGEGTTAPPVMATILLRPGSCYAMTHRDAWHDVRPVEGPSLSFMLTGAPWDRSAPVQPEHPLHPMPEADVLELLGAFQAACGDRSVRGAPR